MTRAEHLAWCKERALEYVERGEIVNAYKSMASDMGKHPETDSHSEIVLGMRLMMSGHLSTPEQMRDYINGFN